MKPVQQYSLHVLGRWGEVEPAKRNTCLIVIRSILGFTPPQWAYVTKQRKGIAVTQGFARNLDRDVRMQPLKPLRCSTLKRGRLNAMLEVAFDLLEEGCPPPNGITIFLEILLGQAGRKKCEAFLQGEKGAAWISDFTLHSIGVLLFRQKRPEVFDRFAADTLPQFTILSLSDAGYLQLAGANARHNLDFDDAYQFSVARENKLAIATQDKDFQRVRNVMSIRLL